MADTNRTSEFEKRAIGHYNPVQTLSVSLGRMPRVIRRETGLCRDVVGCVAVRREAW